ncbi:GNAT family N-acetyltransferase [Vibrio paucivorans]
MLNSSIIRCDHDCVYWVEIERMFQREWPDFSFDDYSKQLPNPIAFFNQGALVAALAYTFYKHPLKDQQALWVNALYVNLNMRGKGIASKLIEQAMADAESSGYSQLLAYTDAPNLYEHLGWSEIEASSEPNHKVMGIDLTPKYHKQSEQNSYR